ncbi:MAG TPA: hypothetical protein VGF79_07660 [Bacteroidia bacterium]
MKPENANPKNFIVDKVIYTSPDGNFSIAKGEWVEDEMIRFAFRWNGDINNPSDKGYPSVFDNPMWFQLPYDLRDVLSILIRESDPIDLNKYNI